jgi:hypothetical protein
MTAHFNGLVQALQITSGVVKLVYGPRLLTNMIDMQTSLSQKLKYIDITIKIRAFFIASLFDRVWYFTHM